MKMALLSGSARLDDAVGKYTFYLARALAAASDSKVDVVLAGPMSSQFSSESVRIIQFESLPRRAARWVIDRLPLPHSFSNRVKFRFRGWGFRSVRSLAQEISSADLVWDVFSSSSPVHRIPLEMHGESLPSFVLDYHGVTPPELVGPPLSQELQESIEELKICAPAADHYIVHSAYMAEELASRTGINRNTDVIPLFCDPELNVDWQMPKRVVSDRFVILFVGRLGRHKGLDILIRALKIVRDRGFDAEVTIVGKEVAGDDTVRRTSRLATSLGIDEHVFWLGNLNAITLRIHYYSADVLVLPSLHEGFGLPAIEAMWFDVPVIVSNSGALPEVVKNGALVFNANDCEDLAEKVIMLHDNLEVRNRTLNAARSVRESYTLDKFTESVRKVCASCLT